MRRMVRSLTMQKTKDEVATIRFCSKFLLTPMRLTLKVLGSVFLNLPNVEVN